MRAAGALLLGAFIIGPAQAQTAGSTTTGTPPASGLACGALKAATSRTGATSSWTISTPSEKTTESGSLRSGPRFECIDGAILVVEFTSSAGHSFFGAYFPDGMNIGYGRQQIERRGTRFVLPVLSEDMLRRGRIGLDLLVKLADVDAEILRIDRLVAPDLAQQVPAGQHFAASSPRPAPPTQETHRSFVKSRRPDQPGKIRPGEPPSPRRFKSKRAGSEASGSAVHNDAASAGSGG